MIKSWVLSEAHNLLQAQVLIMSSLETILVLNCGTWDLARVSKSVVNVQVHLFTRQMSQITWNIAWIDFTTWIRCTTDFFSMCHRMASTSQQVLMTRVPEWLTLMRHQTLRFAANLIKKKEANLAPWKFTIEWKNCLSLWKTLMIQVLIRRSPWELGCQIQTVIQMNKLLLYVNAIVSSSTRVSKISHKAKKPHRAELIKRSLKFLTEK